MFLKSWASLWNKLLLLFSLGHIFYLFICLQCQGMRSCVLSTGLERWQAKSICIWLKRSSLICLALVCAQFSFLSYCHPCFPIVLGIWQRYLMFNLPCLCDQHLVQRVYSNMLMLMEMALSALMKFTKKSLHSGLWNPLRPSFEVNVPLFICPFH